MEGVYDVKIDAVCAESTCEFYECMKRPKRWEWKLKDDVIALIYDYICKNLNNISQQIFEYQIWQISFYGSHHFP